jgi:Zn-dependent protease with chaperone function
MLDLLPWILTGVAALGTAGFVENWAPLDPAMCLARTLAAAAAPWLLGEMLGALRRAGRRLDERIFLWFPMASPAAAAGALAWGRLSALILSHAPDWPSVADVASVEALAFLCVGSTLLGERRLYRRDGRFEPPGAPARLRLAAVALAAPILWTGALDALSEIPAFRIYYDSYAVLQLAALAALALALIAGLPWIVRLAIPTQTLPAGPLRSAFEGIAVSLGVRVRDFRVARTRYQVSNAALLGGFGARTVLLTDRLLREHPADELVAVVGHELGHARGRHMTTFGLLVFALAVWALAVPEGILAPLGSAGTVAVVAGVFVAFLRWVLGPVARLCEHDADIYGSLAAGTHAPIQTSLERIAGPEHRWKGSWRHPSVGVRVQFLERAAAYPNEAARPARALRRIRWICGIVGIAGLLVFGAVRLGELPAERVAAAIRSGRYDLARAIARDHPGPSMEKWDRLANAAAATGVAGPDTVLERARAAFARGEYDKAALLGRVAALRTGRSTDSLFASVAEEAAAENWPVVAEGIAGPASFLTRDPLLGAAARGLAESAATRPASAPGNPSRRMGT